MEVDKKLLDWLRSPEGGNYLDVRVLPDGTIAAVGDLMFTRGLYLGLTWTGWSRRYCFDERLLANAELHRITGLDDEPRGWIAQR